MMDFNFPFEPYEIQNKLMNVAYETYDKSKFALLESPTGTGKSLSLICSSLTWLFNYRNKVRKELEDRRDKLTKQIDDLKEEEGISGDWLSAQTKRRDVDKELTLVLQDLEKLDKFQAKTEARWLAKLHNEPLEKYAPQSDRKQSDNVARASLERSISIDDDLNQSKLLNSQSSQSQSQDEDENLDKLSDEKEQVKPKIYYASRTHSQLSQFIGEIKRTKFADPNKGPTVKVAPLASRVNLCVNPDVTKLKEASAINEKCMELQRETSSDKKCPYAKLKQVNALKEDILSSVQDIEEIVSRGRTQGSCPYYASKMAISEAEVVVLPYNNLLHHETRKASELDLNDNVVILDEAHNILETICSIHSASINGQQLVGCHTILSRYYIKYHSRMNPKNAVAVKMIVQCLTAIIKYLSDPRQHLTDFESPKILKIEDENQVSKGIDRKTIPTHEELMMDVPKFIGASNIEQFNVFKMVDYFNRSQLARKLLGIFLHDDTIDLSLDLFRIESDGNESTKSSNKNQFRDANGQPGAKRLKVKPKPKQVTKSQRDLNPTSDNKTESTSLIFLEHSNSDVEKHLRQMHAYPLFTLVEFLKSLTNLAEDGKVLTDYHKDDFEKSSLKFILLNPSSQFKQMTDQARSIILAGGTMQPFDEFVDLLFGPLKVSRDRLELFSCGHVIDSKQIFVASLTNGPSKKSLELSYRTRSSMDIIDEFGRTILNLAIVCPAGMVCFLPSYDYEQFCFNRWKTTGIISSIEAKAKQVFREPRQTNQLKPVLEEYARVVGKGRKIGRGALLFCVVGGKMSEGINFNDDLGRCIVMIGLPYANIKSCELQQKINYYNSTCDSKKTHANNQPTAGQQYYENLCIKGINQSIGRAIRHTNDYAAIILLDRRYYCKSSIRNGLPGWMRDSLTDYDQFGPLFGKVKSFFNSIEKKMVTQ